ncbi:LysR family transcriptional regulator [Nesterenkonia muleiensis]|uniref:LysR family transcriptional regulator n=1 Tax=Nesterenkonia muleiensis TaxID=2282648 RepID=UPI000E739077|nr:LysR family transcriptional regulator [Nesterenkonia muleiensis]
MNIRGNPSITLRQLWHFVTAAEAGTISEAARRLHMAPSAISMSLAELDRLTGTQLCVKRKAHGLTLTSAGQAAYVQARQILDLTDEIVHLAGDRSSVRGPLTVGCYMPLAPAVIPHMLRAFAQRYPEVEVNFVEGYHDDLQEQLLVGTIDVAFLYDIGLTPEVRTVSLLEVRPHLLLAEDHRYAGRQDVHLDELSEEPVILFNAPPISTRVLDLFRDQGLTPEVRHRSRSYATVRSLVGAGMGFSVLFQRPRLDLSYAGLGVVSQPLDITAESDPYVALAWSRQIRPNARSRAWTEVAMHSFRNLDGG